MKLSGESNTCFEAAEKDIVGHARRGALGSTPFASR